MIKFRFLMIVLNPILMYLLQSVLVWLIVSCQCTIVLRLVNTDWFIVPKSPRQLAKMSILGTHKPSFQIWWTHVYAICNPVEKLNMDLVGLIVFSWCLRD